MKYAFFPGCVLESAAKEDYLATVAVARKLGIEIEELDGWTCCGASGGWPKRRRPVRAIRRRFG